MPTATPPFDRAVALACTMRTLRGRWLQVRCGCGHSVSHPVRLMLREHPECAGQTLADVLVNLRCRGCRGRRLRVCLGEDAHDPDFLPKSIRPGWSLLLHDAIGPDDPEPVKMAAE